MLGFSIRASGQWNLPAISCELSAYFCFFFFFRSPTSRRFHCPWWVLWICCTEFQSRKQKGHKRHLWAKKEKNYLGCLTMRKHDVQMHVNIALQFCGTCMCLWKGTYFCKNLSDHFLLLTRMCLCFLNFHLAAAIIHTPSHFSIFMLFLGRDRGFVMGSLLLWQVVTASPGFDQFIQKEEGMSPLPRPQHRGPGNQALFAL